MKDEPLSPPLVIREGHEPFPAYLLCWELQERDGEWWAWLTWIRQARGEPYRHVVSVPASGIRAVEAAEAYRDVPRRVRGRDGVIRPWQER